jgi:hypothetical protein
VSELRRWADKMNSDRIKTALKDIEAGVPPGKAEVRFDVYGGGVDESFIRGSRAGLARLGIRLIQAALAEEKKKSMNGAALVAESLDDVVHPSSDMKFDWIEVVDDLEADAAVRVRSQQSQHRTILVGVLFVMVAVVVFIAWKLR